MSPIRLGRRFSAGLARGALIIAGLTMLARLAGFARQLVFARAVGPTCVGSTYQTANTVPNILYEVVAGGALASLVVPLVAGAAHAGDRETVRQTTGALVTWAVTVLVPVALIVGLCARPVVRLVLGGTTCAGAIDLGARMIAVFAPQIVLYGIGVVLTGVLQAHQRFVGPALAPLLSSLVVIAAYLWYWLSPGASGSVGGLGTGSELILSVGTTVGVVALSLSLLVPLHRCGVPIRPTWRFPAGTARRARRLAAAGIAALIAQQASVAVALRLANEGTTAGAVVVYALAQTVFLLPWATVAVPLATSAFPRLSAAVDSGDEPAYARTSSRVSQAVLATSAVAAAVLFAAARPAARILVQGVGGAGDIDALADGIAAFAPGLIGYALMALWSRSLYARHDARTPAYGMVLGWLSVVVADLALTAALPAGRRVLALAAGNSVGMIVAAVLLGAGLLRATGAAALAGLMRTGAAALLAAVVGAAAGRLLADAFDGGGAGAALGQTVVVAAVTAGIAGGVLFGAGGRELFGMLRGVR